MYHPNTIFTAPGMYLDLCKAVLARTSSRVAQPKHLRTHMELDSPAIMVISLDARSPVQLVSLTRASTPQRLEKVRQDIRHFNIFTEFVLTVQFDHNRISLKAIEEDVAAVIAEQVPYPLDLSLCYLNSDEVGFLIEFTDIDTLIQENKLFEEDRFSTPDPQCPITWRIPVEVFDRSFVFNEQWNAHIRKLTYVLEQRPTMTLSPEEHRAYLQHRTKLWKLSHFGAKIHNAMQLIMEHRFSATTLPLAEHILSRFQQCNDNVRGISNMEDFDTWCELVHDKSVVNTARRLITFGSLIETDADVVAELSMFFNFISLAPALQKVEVFNADNHPDNLSGCAIIQQTFYFHYSKEFHLPHLFDKLATALEGIPFVTESDVVSDIYAQRLIQIHVKALVKLPDCFLDLSSLPQLGEDLTQVLSLMASLLEPIETDCIRYYTIKTGPTALESQVRVKLDELWHVEVAGLHALWNNIYK